MTETEKTVLTLLKGPIYDKNEVRYGLISPELGKFHPSREQTITTSGNSLFRPRARAHTLYGLSQIRSSQIKTR